jgi:hypothetical protein
MDILSRINNDIEMIKNKIIPTDFIDMLSLNRNMEKLSKQIALNNPHKFVRILNNDIMVGGGIDKDLSDMKNIFSEYSKVDPSTIEGRMSEMMGVLNILKSKINNMQMKRLPNDVDEIINDTCTKELGNNASKISSMLLRLERSTNDMKENMNSVVKYHEFVFNRSDIEKLIASARVGDFTVQNSSNHFLNDNEITSLNAFYSMIYIIDSPIFNYYVKNERVKEINTDGIFTCIGVDDDIVPDIYESYIDMADKAIEKYEVMRNEYIEFYKSYKRNILMMCQMNMNKRNVKVFRYLDKSVLDKYIDFITELKKSNGDFCERYSFTVDSVTNFIYRLLSMLKEDEVIDIALINTRKLDKISLQLNYMLSMINYFKIFLDKLLHNK